MKINQQNIVGTWVVIEHLKRQYVGTVMDTVAGTNQPKRVRIQRGPLQGEVVIPSQYTYLHPLAETEVDD